MDDWEDFEADATISVAAIVKSTSNNFDDEEDLVELNEDIRSAALTQAQLDAQAKKQAEDEIKLANKLKYAALANESTDDRIIRERKLVEESDNELAGELFSGLSTAIKVPAASASSSGSATPVSLSSKTSSTKPSAGLVSIATSTKQDHINFGILCSKKLESSTSFNITSFIESFIDNIEKKLAPESLDKVIDTLNKIRTDRNAKIASKKDNTRAKKAVKEEKKKKDEIYGRSDYADEYADYSNIEDDYM